MTVRSESSRPVLRRVRRRGLSQQLPDRPLDLEPEGQAEHRRKESSSGSALACLCPVRNPKEKRSELERDYLALYHNVLDCCREIVETGLRPAEQRVRCWTASAVNGSRNCAHTPRVLVATDFADMLARAPDALLEVVAVRADGPDGRFAALVAGIGFA